MTFGDPIPQFSMNTPKFADTGQLIPRDVFDSFVIRGL
jgi:hypothetical protein